MVEKRKSRIGQLLAGLSIIAGESVSVMVGKQATAEEIAEEERKLSQAAEPRLMWPIDRDDQLRNLPAQFPKTPGWQEAKPDSIPAPTYTPAIMAFGITFFALGLITKWYVAAVGLVVFAISVWLWFGELRHE